MRLLNTSTLKFKEFLSPPPYAILSHRWGDEEVTFEEYVSGKQLGGQGYEKILQSCDFARTRGHEYIWIDTCCIDKRSSAELSESINSMWDWYSKAKECYAYLADVMSLDPLKPLNATPKRPSEWFSRGWTLQELLAPRVVIFLDHHWCVIGQKLDRLILEEVSQITLVPVACLESPFMLHTACVAQKLSWASRRSTSRREDIAYCLLGLVGINMPLLYGEGDKAFIRLQQEIIRQTDDESVFAWRQPYASKTYMSGLLASSVNFFLNSADVRTLDLERNPYTITNKGLDLTVFSFWDTASDTHIIPLNCQYGGTAATRVTQRCAIAVRRERNLYSRVDVEGLGYHLHATYPTFMEHSLKSHRLRIRLSRWQNEYEQAGFIIKLFIERARATAESKSLLSNQMSCSWSQPLADNYLKSAEADVMTILDCCYASSAIHREREAQYPLLVSASKRAEDIPTSKGLAAASRQQQSEVSVDPSSFTRALIQSLEQFNSNDSSQSTKNNLITRLESKHQL